MRRLLLLTLAFLLWSSLAFAASEDQEITAQWDAVTGDQSITFGTPPTAGSTVLFMGAVVGSDVGVDFEFDAVTPISDLDGNTWGITQSSVAGQAIAFIARADNVTSAGTFTITLHPSAAFSGTGSGAYYTLLAGKSFTGLANPALDKVGTTADPGPQASDATVSLTSPPTTQANETVIAVMGVCIGGEADMQILTPTTGYNPIITENDCGPTGHQPGNISWKNVTAAGDQSASWSHRDIVSNNSYDGWVAVIVTLYDTVAGGGAAPRRRAVIVQ